MVSANDIYRDTSFMGGLLDFEFSETYLGLTGALNTVNPLGDTASDPALLSGLAGIEADHANGLASYHAATTANVLSGGDEAYDGSYWQARNPQNVLARVVANRIPAYIVGGEFDIFQNGEPLNYAALQNAWAGRSVTAPMRSGQRTTGRYQLIDGPWEHINGSSVDVDRLELEWFDTWLKHEATGMARTPTPLHYYDLGSGQFDETATYPFTRATPTRLYFGRRRNAHLGRLRRGRRGRWPARLAVRNVTGARPCLSSAARLPTPAPRLPGDERHARLEPGRQSVRAPDRPVVDGRHLDSVAHRRADGPCADDDRLTEAGPWAIRYTTAPFAHAETVAGPVTATVYASATTSETELVAELEDVTPSGASYPLTEGALLGSLRAVDRSGRGPPVA